MSQPAFEIDASELIERQALSQGVTITPNADPAALRALGALLHESSLPDRPRFLVLGPDQRPIDDEYIPIEFASGTNRRLYIPTVRGKNDIDVRLPSWEITTRNLTEGLARTIINHRRQRQRLVGNRIGAGIITAGVGVMGAAIATGNELLGYGGGALLAVGGGIMTVLKPRGAIKVPDEVYDLEPVLRAVPFGQA